MTEATRKNETTKDERNSERQNLEWERFKKFARRVVAVPKVELEEQRAKYKREKQGERAD
jgi:hypothetical protein